MSPSLDGRLGRWLGCDYRPLIEMVSWQRSVQAGRAAARPIKVGIEELCEDLGIPQWEDDRFDTGDAYGYAYNVAVKEAEEEGLDPDAADEFAEERALEAEREMIDGLYRAHMNAAEEAIEQTLEPANLVVSCEAGKCLVEPKVSWEDSAKQIVKVINGIGYFHFNSLREFLDSGPYTAREAVEGHLHHMARYGEVYGGPSPSRIYERSFDSYARNLV